MKRYSVLAVCSVAVVLAACADAASPARPVDPIAVVASASVQWGFDAANASTLRLHPTVQMARVAGPGSGVFAGLPILYHANGRVIPAPKAAAIYWSSSVIYPGGPPPGTAGLGSADGSVVGAFLRSLGKSSYWSINNEYTDNVGGPHAVANSVNYTRYYANNVGAPGPGANVSDAAIRTMLKSVVGGVNLPFDQQTIYTVFSGPGVNLGGGFGTTYCAYHSFVARPGFPGSWILYAVLPRAADLLGVCTAVNTPVTGSPNEFSADAVINLLATQLDEAVTDPGLNAWFDASGFENAAKCPWLFTPTFTAPNGSTANARLGGKDYLIQQNWRIGPNALNQIGCTLVGNMPLISLTPPTLTFNATQSGANPASQFSTITNAGGGTLNGLTVGTIVYGPGATGWLQAPVLSSPTANPSATLTIQPVTGSLPPGTYTATVPVQSTVAGNTPQDVTVTFIVAPAGPTISLSSSSLGFTATQTLNPPSSQQITVTYNGGGTFVDLSIGQVTYGPGASGWLYAPILTAATVSSAAVIVLVSDVSLKPGIYTANIPIVSAVAVNSPQNLTVTLTITAGGVCPVAGAPTISVGQTIPGTIANTDCQRATGDFADVYLLTLASQTDVQIDFTSTAFNFAGLRLYESGTEVVIANAIFGQNPRLTRRLNAGTYIIQGSGDQSGATGSYQMAVSTTAVPIPNDGIWTGTGSDGKFISFVVQLDKVIRFTIDIGALGFGCSSFVVSTVANAPITAGAFSFSFSGGTLIATNISGSIASLASATGNYTDILISNYPCGFSNWTTVIPARAWTAARK